MRKSKKFTFCFKHFIFGLMIMGLVFGSVSMVAASTITINSVVGDWLNAVPPPPVVTIVNGSTLSTASWGTDIGYGQSEYAFSPATTPFNANSNGTKFALGKFTHYNNPITGDALTSIDLKTLLNIQGFGVLSATFSFTHDETPNNYEPPTDPRNDDIVTLTNPVLNAHFTSGGFDYYFNLIGFSQDGGNTLSTVFYTVETLTNNATLYGEITGTPVSTPEPTTMLLLGLGLVGLATLRRKF